MSCVVHSSQDAVVKASPESHFGSFARRIGHPKIMSSSQQDTVASADGSEAVEGQSTKPEKQTRLQLANALNKFKPSSRQALKSPPKASEHMI